MVPLLELGRLLASMPIARAPIRPPTVYIEDTRPNWVEFMGMQLGRPLIVGVVVVVIEVRRRERSVWGLEVKGLAAHLRTASGALSSAWWNERRG